MDINEFTERFSEIVSETDVAAETELSALNGWDSLSQVTFIAFVRRQFGRVINVSGLKDAHTVADLFALAKG